MARTVKLDQGAADITPSFTGTEGRSGSIETGMFASGPPRRGQGQHRGIYIRQIAGANGTWRWIRDEWTPGAASPTTFLLLPQYSV